MFDDDEPKRIMQLTLVFEYIEQDLSLFLQHYPKKKLPPNEIKVHIVLSNFIVC